MASLQITIEIAAAVTEGHSLNVARRFGRTEGDILNRIATANAATYPKHNFDQTDILVKAIAAAVAAAEI